MFTNYIFQAFKLCSTGEEGFDLSYDSLTSEKAKAALAKRVKNSKAFVNSLSCMEPIGTEEDDEVDGDDEGERTVEYDEIDSSKTLEEIADLMTTQTADDPSDEGEVCIGTNLEEFIGYEFSTRAATTAWMKWDTMGSH